MRSKPDVKRKRKTLFGPGTIIAVIAVIGIVVYGRLGPLTNSSNGQIMYEADAGGRMHEVKAATTPQVKPSSLTKPLSLVKPEVALIAQHSSDLRLSSSQKQQVDAINAAWKLEKTELEAAMNKAVSTANGQRNEAQVNHSASSQRVTEILGDYSRLSHQYNERRSAYWMQATATLEPEQKTILERIMTSDRKGNSQ